MQRHSTKAALSRVVDHPELRPRRRLNPRSDDLESNRRSSTEVGSQPVTNGRAMRRGVFLLMWHTPIPQEPSNQGGPACTQG